MGFGERQITLANFTFHIGQISSAQNVGEIEKVPKMSRIISIAPIRYT
jgi:hypothetical protein